MSAFDQLLTGFFGEEGPDDSSLGKSSSHSDGEKATVTRGLGVACYAVLFVVSLLNYIFKRKNSKRKIPVMVQTFYICLPLFMFLRVMWLIFELVLESTDNVGLDRFNSILNRVCMCIFLYVFNSLLFYWIDTVHTTVTASLAKDAMGGNLNFGFVTPCGRLLFYAATGAVILLILILAVIRVCITASMHSDDDNYSTEKTATNNLRDANNMIISIMFLVFGFCFLFYGTKLNCRIGKKEGSGLNELWKTELFSVCLCICFLLRFVFFSYRIFTGKEEIDMNVFIIFTYYVPELIPAALILWSINTTMFKQSDNGETALAGSDTFVDPLLAEEKEDELRTAVYLQDA